MRQDVNLLTTKKQTRQKASSVLVLGTFILLLVVIVTVASLFYTLFLKNQILTSVREKDSIVKEIRDMEEERIKIQTIHERLLSVEKILPNNQKLSERLSIISSGIPGNIEVSTIKIEGSKIFFVATSPSLALLNDFLNNGLEEILKNKEGRIKKIDVENFGLTKGGGGYSASVLFTFDTSVD